MIRNKVKQLVDSRGLTVYRFCRETGLSRNTGYDLYNRPERYPMADAMDRICKAYNVSPEDVIEWIPD